MPKESRNDRLTIAPEPLNVDLILDLLETPVVSRVVPPPGYFSNLPTGNEREQVLNQLDNWIGEFEKPKFFKFNPRLCAHHSSGIFGCSACKDNCPTGAISSDAGKISIDPHLCQGCGDCAMVCPSGAIRYHYPSPEITLDDIRCQLRHDEAPTSKPKAVLFHDTESGKQWISDHSSAIQENLLLFELESIVAAGPDIWLSTLAYGASSVLLLNNEDVNTLSFQSLTTQVKYANEILTGMGMNPAIRMVSTVDDINVALDRFQTTMQPFPATYAGIGDKRTVIRLALDFLIRGQNSIPEHTDLSSGAPFGEIAVNTDRCTLCMACVSVCPESALMDGFDEPKLSFIEANCVQCGICEQACPENAIELVPRYLYSSPAARKARLLNKNQPYNCIQCGKPFATVKVIEAIKNKLESHPMFQGNQLERLQMCEDCRVKSFFSVQ